MSKRTPRKLSNEDLCTEAEIEVSSLVRSPPHSPVPFSQRAIVAELTRELVRRFEASEEKAEGMALDVEQKTIDQAQKWSQLCDLLGIED